MFSGALNRNSDIVKYLVRSNLLKIVFGLIEDIYDKTTELQTAAS